MDNKSILKIKYKKKVNFGFIERTMCEITAETSYNDSCETEAKISEKLHSEIQARKRDVFAMKFENNKNFDHIAKIG